MKRIKNFPALMESIKQKRAYKENVKQGHDIALDPYIDFGITTNSNWPRSYLKVNDYMASSIVFRRKAVVFIIDTAGEITHPDVLPYVANKYGKDFTGEGVFDGNGHGTGCASCYVGKVNGVGPREDIIIVPIKVLRNNGSGSYLQVLNGVKYAYDTWKNHFPNYLGVISMSLGGGSSYKPLSDLMSSIRKAGMWIAASSGNSGYSETVNRVGFPAKDPSAWAIGAMDSAGRIASFSSAGKELVFTGPGRSVQIAWKDNSYINANGTSFGMPYCMASLLWMACQYPQLSSMDKAEEYYKKYVTDLHTKGRDVGTGYGVPVLSPFIGQIPDDKPGGNPPPPPPDPPKEEEPPKDTPPRSTARTLRFPFQRNNWKLVWQENGKAGRNTIYCKAIEIEHTTKELAPTAYTAIENGLNWFFSGRGLVLSIDRDKKTVAQLKQLYRFSKELTTKTPTMVFLPFANASEPKDFHDAGYWTGRFIQVLLKNDKKITVKVKSITVADEKGRTATINI